MKFTLNAFEENSFEGYSAAVITILLINLNADIYISYYADNLKRPTLPTYNESLFYSNYTHMRINCLSKIL